MACDAVFDSSDVLDELVPWGLGAWLPQTPPYAGFCDPKAVAVSLDQLLRILLDERPWAQHLNDMDAADAVGSWLRGVLRDLATRRRVSKAWAAAGQRCFDALVAELRRRGAAHARAARAFLDEEPKVYPGELPPGSWIDSRREDLVRPWSKDAEGAKHVPLIQALFEHCFHHHALVLSPLEVQSEISENIYAKHSVWPRQWVEHLAALAVPINERQLWDTLHRRCRCCPRSSPCCLQADREQVLHRGGGDGCGSDHRRLVQLGPWPETKARGLARVGRSALPSYVAIATAPVTTVSNPVCETANGMPCMHCNPCDRVVLPYTHDRDVVTVCIRRVHALGDVHCTVVHTRGSDWNSSGRLMIMMIRGGSKVRHSKWNVAMRSLYRRRELALLAARGPRGPCTCGPDSSDVSRSGLHISLPLFHVEDGVDNSWASVLGLDRAGLFREAVQWPRLQMGLPINVDHWRCYELERRIALLDESLPGKYATDFSIMLRTAGKRLISPSAIIHRTTVGMAPEVVHCSRWNLEHLHMYPPLWPLLESVSADQAKAKELGVAASTQYCECFGDDGSMMVEYFQRVECMLGPAWRCLEARAMGPLGYPERALQEECEFGPRRTVMRRIARAYIHANPRPPPMSGSQRLQAVADVPANSPTHPELLLRWYLAAICNQVQPYENAVALSLVQVLWKPLPPQSAGGSPPTTFPEAEMVVHLTFWAPHAPAVRKHMRFGFAVRMRDFDRLCCATLGLGGDEHAQPLSMREWSLYAAGLVEKVTRHVCVCDLRRLELLETVLSLPWAPVFPLARTLHEKSTDAPEGTLGMCALKRLCHHRDGWLGRVYPNRGNN